jgi:multisubunit Na+/H+ antiporter MnhB subunit
MTTNGNGNGNNNGAKADARIRWLTHFVMPFMLAVVIAIFGAVSNSPVFKDTGLLPHGADYLWKPSLVWAHVISDCILSITGYIFAIQIVYVYIVRSRQSKNKKPITVDMIQLPLLLWVVLLLVTKGNLHLMDVVNTWEHYYWGELLNRCLAAVAAIGTCVEMQMAIPRIGGITTISVMMRDMDKMKSDLETMSQQLSATKANKLAE